LLDLLSKLVLRQSVSSDSNFLDKLSILRSQIDRFDEQLLDLLFTCMKFA